MKENKKMSKKTKLALKIAASVSLLSLSFGIVFGISAASFKLSYIDLSDLAKRKYASDSRTGEAIYVDQKSTSGWNMTDVDGMGIKAEDFVPAPTSKQATAKSRAERHQPFFDKEANGAKVGVQYYDGKLWSELDPNNDEDYQIIHQIMNERYDISKFTLDGKDHTALDHSFNQSLYTGIIRYIHGGMKYKNGEWIEGIYDDDITAPTNDKDIEISQNIAFLQKPTEDTTSGLQQAYERAIKGTTDAYPYLLHLVGYLHASPLSAYFNSDNIKVDSQNGKKYVDLPGEIGQSSIFLYDGSVPNNQYISSNLFRADQSAFLCALATCCFFLKNIDIYYSDTRPLSIGVFGGVNFSTVSVFMGGIQRGVELFNNHILPNLVDKILADDDLPKDNFLDLVNFVENKYQNDASLREKIINDLSVRIISLDKTSAYFTGSFVVGDALGISRELLNRQACAIICVAGPQGVDTVQEISSRSSNCIMIGVDSAMELSDFQADNLSPIKTKEPAEIDPRIRNGIFKFSATKNVSYFAKKQSELFTQDLNWDIDAADDQTKPDPQRSICSIGYNTNGNLLNGGCGISEAGWYYLTTILQYLQLVKKDDGNEGKFFNDIWDNSKDLKESFLKIHNIDPKDKEIFMNEKFSDLIAVPTAAEGASDVSFSLINDYAMYSEFLGEILDRYGVNFAATETAKDAGYSSILQWLDDNMYFIS